MKTLLLASVAISSLVLAGSAVADTVDLAPLTVTQTNTGTIAASLGNDDTTSKTPNVAKDIENVGKKVSETVAAIGNSASVTDPKTGGSAKGVDITQTNNATVSATLLTVEKNIDGTVTDTVAAIGDSASIKLTNSYGDLKDTQTNEGSGVTANLGTTTTPVDLSTINGDITLTSAAIGNSYTASGDTVKGKVQDLDVQGSIDLTQTNKAPVSAYSNVNIEDMQHNVTSTTAAIGNSMSVTADAAKPHGVADANFTQTNNNTIKAAAEVDKNYTDATKNIAGDLSTTVAAIGNSLNVTGDFKDGHAGVDNTNVTQTNTGGIDATLTQTANVVNGKLTQTVAAIGNSASIKSTNYGLNVNQNNSGDVNALANIYDVSIGEDGKGPKNISETVAAIGNSLTLDVTSTVPDVTDQVNSGAITATNNADFNAISGNLTSTTAAIGNSATIDLADLKYGDTLTQNNSGGITANSNESIININYTTGKAQDVSLTTAAIGNSLSFTGVSKGNSIIDQTNTGEIQAVAQYSVAQVSGNLSLTVAAIGNSASITVKH